MAELGPLPPTIRSRCQHVPFRRLSQRAVKAYLSTRGVAGEKLDALARLAGGRLDRADRLLNEEAGERRSVLIGLARSVYQTEEREALLSATISNLKLALDLDPTNAEPKYNLELAYQQGRGLQLSEASAGQNPSPGGSGSQGAGAGEPGSGY